MHFKELIELNEKANIDYDLQKKYDYFNKLLFKNELPKVPLKFVRSKKYGGLLMTSYWYKDRRKTRVEKFEYQYLALSTFSLKTEAELDMIMVHEMIHVWMTENDYHEGINVQSHGNEYVTKRNEIQSKVGFDIPLKDYLPVEVRDKKEKIYGVIIGASKLGQAVTVLKQETLEDNIEKLKEMFTRGGAAGTTYTFAISPNPELEQYKIKRTIRSVEMFYMKDSVYNAVTDDMTTLARIEL